MKTFKDIIGEAADSNMPRREKAFKDKHIVQKINHPVAGDDQFAAPKIKKDKTKHASHHDGEDAAVYEAVEISHDRYMRSHGKKASGGHGMWMFTHKNRGDVDHNNEKEVHTASGKFSDAAKSAKAWAKKHGHSTAYVMEEIEQTHESAMSDAEMKKREDIVKGMKKNKADFKKRYGDRWKSVMYATATKNAMKESVEQIDEDITKMSHGRLKWHMNTGVPHGSYSKDEMKAERDRRLKTGENEAYRKAKAGLNESEQIDELSKSTMGSYIGKASADMQKKKDQVSKGSLSMTDLKKGQKRNTMITKAQDKAHAMESVDLDEAFKAGSMKLKDGSSATVTKESADVLNSLFKQLNSANKAKMEERLMSGTKGFNEILAFAKEAM